MIVDVRVFCRSCFCFVCFFLRGLVKVKMPNHVQTDFSLITMHFSTVNRNKNIKRLQVFLRQFAFSYLLTIINDVNELQKVKNITPDIHVRHQQRT